MRRIKPKKGAAPLRYADENEKSKFVSYSPWKSSMKCVFTSMIILFALYYLYSLSVHTKSTQSVNSPPDPVSKQAKLQAMMDQLQHAREQNLVDDDREQISKSAAEKESVKKIEREAVTPTTSRPTLSPSPPPTEEVITQPETPEEKPSNEEAQPVVDANADAAEEAESETIDPEHDVHVVISSGCHYGQNWQAEVFMQSWYRLRHPGKITRLVSGCANKEEEEIATRTAVPGANMVVTPDYSMIGYDKKKSHYWNKPYGMWYWLNNTDVKESVIILVDPDMILTKKFDNHLPSAGELYVQPGKPVAQLYGVGCRWNEWGFCKEKGCELTCREAWNEYSAGPPYMQHISDWKRFMPLWAKYSQLSRQQDPWPGIMYEMFGYSLAAASLDMKHKLPKKWMLSSLGSRPVGGLEGWEQLHDPDLTLPEPPCPIFHYCQGYYLGGRGRSSPRQGGFNWHKGHVPREILHTCDMPLLAEIPIGKKAHAADQDETKRNIYMIHWIIKYFNWGVAEYRNKYCPDGWNNTKTIYLQQPSPRSWYVPGEHIPWDQHKPPVGD